MNNDFVEDDEILYRCVFYGKNYYLVMDDNSIKISSQAFLDRNQRPSVDRSKLCNYDPRHTQKDPRNGVVSLVTKDVRSTDTVIQNDQKGKLEFTYKIDVVYQPLKDNNAHAQIESSPEYRNQTPFRKKLLIRLAFLANQREWEIKPQIE